MTFISESALSVFFYQIYFFFFLLINSEVSNGKIKQHFMVVHGLTTVTEHWGHMVTRQNLIGPFVFIPSFDGAFFKVCVIPIFQLIPCKFHVIFKWLSDLQKHIIISLS